MGQILRYFCCFILGVCVALSMSLSSSESFRISSQDDYDYPLLMDVIDTIETYYVDSIDRQTLINGAIQGIFKQLDPYSGFLKQDDYQTVSQSNNGKYFGFGFEVATTNGQITVVTPFKNSPAARANIKAGDQIVRLNDVDVNAINLQTVLTSIRRHSINNQAINITIKSINDGEIVDRVLSPETVHIDSIESKILPDNIGYIRIATFQQNTAESIFYQAKRWQHIPLKGLILDVRNNPGGLLDQAIKIADLFLAEGRIVTTTGRYFDANEDYYANPSSLFPTIPIVVLINKGSASASEVLAAALSENKRATLIGETSFGKGTVQSLIPVLGQGSAIKLTIAEYFTPKGNNIHEKGIVPDVKVDDLGVTHVKNSAIIKIQTQELAHVDNQMDTAIEWFSK